MIKTNFLDIFRHILWKESDTIFSTSYFTHTNTYAKIMKNISQLMFRLDTDNDELNNSLTGTPLDPLHQHLDSEYYQLTLSVPGAFDFF